jgi:hypothetical protein
VADDALDDAFIEKIRNARHCANARKTQSPGRLRWGAGRYMPQVKLCNQVLCHAGGLSDCKQCVNAHDIGSLSLFQGGPWVTSIPNKDLDLDLPSKDYILSAWIKKPAKPETYYNDTAAVPEYIISCTSGEGNLKEGYEMSMLLLNASTSLYMVSFELWWLESDEPAVVSKQAKVEGEMVFPPKEWVWLASDVSSENLTLYSFQDGRDLTMIQTSIPNIPLRIVSSGMLHIGQNFTGLIDNVIIDVKPPDDLELQQYSQCPYSSALAAYRFNEKDGAWTSMAKLIKVDEFQRTGEESLAQHTNNVYAANIETHGIIGLVASSAQDGSNLMLECPNSLGSRDVVITHILVADLGDGTINNISGAFEPGACVDARAALSLVTKECFGEVTCSISVNTTELRLQGLLGECEGEPTRTLSVVVSCAPQNPSTLWSVDSAPSKFGDLVGGDVFEMCSEMVAEWLPEGAIPLRWQNTFSDCDNSEVGQAQATVNSYLGIYMLDKCGVRHMWPAGSNRSDISATLVWNRGHQTRDGACEGEPLATQPLELWLGNHATGLNEAACSDDNVMLFKYVPVEAGKAMVKIKHNGELLYESDIHVAAGPPSAQHSIIGGSILMSPTAGQPATLVIEAKDAAANTLDIPCEEFQERLLVEINPDVDVTYFPTDKLGFCELVIEFRQAGKHTINITTSMDGLDYSYLFPDGRNTVVKTVAVASGVILMANSVSGISPEGRIATAAASCSGDLVMFGGADARRSYVYDTWRFSSKEYSVFTFQTPIRVSGGTATAKFTLGLTLNTKKMIQAGQMRSDCEDIMFVSKAGEALKYWLDPLPGCNAESTLIWLQLPNGENVTMYHGGTAPVRTLDPLHLHIVTSHIVLLV